MSGVAPQGSEVEELSAGWQLARSTPGQCGDPAALSSLEWLAASVPGTVAGALRTAGEWQPGDSDDFDQHDWWFRTRFEGRPAAEDEQVVLALDGIATVAEVYLNGGRLLDSASMFATHELDVGGLLGTENELAICCRALGPLLRVSRRPRARWRTRLVSEGNLRFFRTMLLGRAPGFAPGPATVGPWRAVRLERRRKLVLEELELRPRVQGTDGVLAVRARIRALTAGQPIGPVAVELTGPTGVHRAELSLDAGAEGSGASGTLAVPEVELWWPHTHGRPTLYDARLIVHAAGGEFEFDAGRVGFRRLQAAEDLERDGIALQINGVPVFARGAVWTPVDLAAPHAPASALRRVLETVCGGGMNMLRVPGIACYENRAFYDLCDELGILVWQDFMFANLDYPEQDSEFMAAVEGEARQVLGELAGRPSLAVLCGGSEVAQQVAMLGLDPQLANGPLYGELLPSLVAQAEIDAPYIPSAPWGGNLPFRPDRGVANYYGVGAYLRPLEDARRSQVRFAAECLAFANVPDEPALEAMQAPGGLVVHHPRWKAGVPRDAGAGWDFEDVRDHYLRRLYEIDPVMLRSTDHERYLELSRFTSGEVMAEVFGEWRRAASPCAGGLVLWLTDLAPGPGWGVLDHRGEPKVAFHHLRRALAPVAVWSTDEGLSGVAVHVVNDGPDPLTANLRVALYRDFEIPVEQVECAIALGPHGACEHNVEELLGRFVDVTWSYRFGPPGQDLIVVSLESNGEQGKQLLSQSFRLPVGRPTGGEPPARLGLSASLCELEDGAACLSVSAKRFAYGLRVHVPGFVPEDDGFSLEPGHERRVRLERVEPDARPAGALTALNLRGAVKIAADTVTV